ncbi:MAG: hypothetical protein LBT43_06105 [Prevotella sp.]|jgi:hypothetical protein|nr:hypothetical protein [Prevotella sp.]
MNVSFILDWGLDFFRFKTYDWKLPYFPNIGHSIEILEIFCPNGREEDYLNNEYLKEFWSIEFKGRGEYSGQVITMSRLLLNAYSLKITEINWMSDTAEIFLTSKLYNKDLWEQK